MTSGNHGKQRGGTGRPLMHPTSKNHVQTMEERHKSRTMKEHEIMKIRSEKLTPLKYQSKSHGFHLQIH